jgi:hypothetical protein
MDQHIRQNVFIYDEEAKGGTRSDHSTEQMIAFNLPAPGVAGCEAIIHRKNKKVTAIHIKTYGSLPAITAQVSMEKGLASVCHICDVHISDRHAAQASDALRAFIRILGDYGLCLPTNGLKAQSVGDGIHGYMSEDFPEVKALPRDVFKVFRPILESLAGRAEIIRQNAIKETDSLFA